MYSLKSRSLQGSKDLKVIPLVVRYAAGVPSIASNPSGEAVVVADTGVGVFTLTFADAGIAPLIVPAVSVLPTDASTLGLVANLDAAPTASVVAVRVNSGADGATETDPVDVHLLVLKQVEAA